MVPVRRVDDELIRTLAARDDRDKVVRHGLAQSVIDRDGCSEPERDCYKFRRQCRLFQVVEVVSRAAENRARHVFREPTFRGNPRHVAVCGNQSELLTRPAPGNHLPSITRGFSFVDDDGGFGALA